MDHPTSGQSFPAFATSIKTQLPRRSGSVWLPFAANTLKAGRAAFWLSVVLVISISLPLLMCTHLRPHLKGLPAAAPVSEADKENPSAPLTWRHPVDRVKAVIYDPTASLACTMNALLGLPLAVPFNHCHGEGATQDGRCPFCDTMLTGSVRPSTHRHIGSLFLSNT